MEERKTILELHQENRRSKALYEIKDGKSQEHFRFENGVYSLPERGPCPAETENEKKKEKKKKRKTRAGGKRQVNISPEHPILPKHVSVKRRNRRDDWGEGKSFKISRTSEGFTRVRSH